MSTIKIWMELSAKDRLIVSALAETGESKVGDLLCRVGMSSSLFPLIENAYRKKDL